MIKVTDKQREQILQYTNGMILPPNEIMNIDDTTKLKLLQITPEKAVEKRMVGTTEIPYVKIGYVERALNFVSNFNRGLKVQREGFKEYVRQKKIWDKQSKGWKVDAQGKLVTEDQKVFDARCIADFWIELNGKRIERSCYGTWQMFENPAVSDYAVLEASRSQATKSFADTLGIGSDVMIAEGSALQNARKQMEIIEPSSLQDIAKNFNTNQPNDNV